MTMRESILRFVKPVYFDKTIAADGRAAERAQVESRRGAKKLVPVS